nr:hypothetical protein Iba_chr12aCG20800 [Ipomoea batatas]
MACVVRTIPATEAEFCRAHLVTLAGSMTPASTRDAGATNAFKSKENRSVAFFTFCTISAPNFSSASSTKVAFFASSMRSLRSSSSVSVAAPTLITATPPDNLAILSATSAIMVIESFVIVTFLAIPSASTWVFSTRSPNSLAWYSAPEINKQNELDKVNKENFHNQEEDDSMDSTPSGPTLSIALAIMVPMVSSFPAEIEAIAVEKAFADAISKENPVGVKAAVDNRNSGVLQSVI